jgi:hypothetical protein
VIKGPTVQVGSTGDGNSGEFLADATHDHLMGERSRSDSVTLRTDNSSTTPTGRGRHPALG